MGHFLVYFPDFWGNFFSSPKHPALSRTISNGFVAPRRNLEKYKDTIPRKRPDRQKDGRIDGGMDGRLGGPILWDPSGYRRRSKKNKNLFILSDKV